MIVGALIGLLLASALVVVANREATDAVSGVAKVVAAVTFMVTTGALIGTLV